MSKISEIIRVIGLALSASHNTITTDDVNAQPKKDYSWRIDNSQEIVLLSELEQMLFKNIDTCPVCGHCNKSLLNLQTGDR